MNLHEYQSKQLFAQYAIPVPKGQVASSPDAAVAAAQELGGSLWVVKAQVHAGGRGKAGGVKVAKDLDSVRSATQAMLGTRLVIHDSMIASGATLRHEYHVAGRTLYLHEVADPNLGTYSPTITHVVTSAKDAITLMTRSDVQFRREAIVHAPLPDSLVEARSQRQR